MPFLPLIPDANDIPSISQGNILNNFSILGAIAGNANPASASINVTSGFNWIYLPSNGSQPPAGSSFPAGSVALYGSTKTYPGPISTQEIYVNKTNQATIVQIPITGSILSYTSSPGTSSNGWTYLPSGLLLMWGIANTGNTAAGSYLISLTAGYPAFSQIFNCQLTPIANGAVDPNSSYNLQAFLTAGQNFTVRQSARDISGGATTNTQFFYLLTGIPTAY